jgi:ribosome-associated protein
VELLFDPGASLAFTAAQRERVLRALAPRLVAGRVSLVGSEQRSQLRNRNAARERLVAALRKALAPPPPPRVPTKPSKSARRRRVEAKKRRGRTKSLRGRVTGD